MSSMNESNLPALSMKEMVALSGLSEHTLRYYERVGLIEPVARDDSSGHRRYSRDTLLLVSTLARLRASGLSLEAMRTYLRLRGCGVEGARQQRELFAAHAQEVAAQIAKLQLRQEFLAGKAAYWEACERGDQEAAQKIAADNQKVGKQLMQGAKEKE